MKTKIELIEKNLSLVKEGAIEGAYEPKTEAWYQYIVGLPHSIGMSYMIVIMHNQVMNGGFDQYFVNLYGQFAFRTIDCLKEIAATLTAGLLSEALAEVNKENLPETEFRRRLLAGELLMFEIDELSRNLDRLDAIYYESEEDCIELLGEFLFRLES